MKRILLTLLLIGLLPLSHFAQTPTEEPQYVMQVHLKGEQPILVPVEEIDSVKFIVSEGVREFTLSPAQVELQVGESQQLSVAVIPVDASYAVSYESSNATVATVTAEGLVQALAAGTATVTATIGKLQKQCSITVLAPVQPTRPKIAISDVAEYNLATDDAFATTYDNESNIRYKWSEAVEKFAEVEIAGAKYHLPNKYELSVIAPMITDGDFIKYKYPMSQSDNVEAIEIRGDKKTYSASYISQGNGVCYALRLCQATEAKEEGFPAATDNSMRCAYKYERVESFFEGSTKSQLRVTVCYLGDDFEGTLSDIAQEEWWTERQSDCVVRVFPASGYISSITGESKYVGLHGYCWSSSENGETTSWGFFFNNSHAYQSQCNKEEAYPIRLFISE